MNLKAASTDTLEQAVTHFESLISQARGLQLDVVDELDRRQTPLADGCRSMPEWLAGRVDLGPETANAIARISKAIQDLPELRKRIQSGEVTFDRAVELAKLSTSDTEQEVLDEARRWDVAGLRREVAQQRRITTDKERQTFEDRFFAMQPSLDRSWWRMWGGLPGAQGSIVSKALLAKEATFPAFPDEVRPTMAQRQADALVAISQDSLSGADGAKGHSTPLITLFVDADRAGRTKGESGVRVAAGPRVGPESLSALLCDGSVEIIGTDSIGQPLALGRRSKVVPPRLKRFVIHRDGGCAAEGCTSRYRLEAHHRVPYSGGGATDADNLSTLCWFHHHVVIHGMGYRIDPDSPAQRLRFIRPESRDPPYRPVAA